MDVGGDAREKMRRVDPPRWRKGGRAGERPFSRRGDRQTRTTARSSRPSLHSIDPSRKRIIGWPRAMLDARCSSIGDAVGVNAGNYALLRPGSFRPGSGISRAISSLFNGASY